MPRVFYSAILKAPSDRIWQVLRDFGGLHRWLPGVVQCAVEDGCRGDQVGAVRQLVVRDGGAFREQLVALSDYDLTLAYTILEAPFALTDHLAELRVIPVTEGGGSFVGWSAEFNCPTTSHDKTSRFMVDEVFRPGLTALERGLTT
ncbi:SRPBCC family protein [Ruegeria pomeroyi]|uniref:SRPBCC family protein n=1 Tax=Ruegeria pomeroyi TaxID=89184 RepID=A0A9Q3WPY5_9RHOB|nr:SRPBCC family protein [Ruegeria pomeroyi]MCE8539958.1 SRPBCC family protein [Ruegeria pomeroyi]